MIDRVEILVSALRRFVSRNRWSARLLGADPVIGHADEPGLILIQVDGLGEQVFRKALSDGKMPFLRHLVRDEGYIPRSFYSGMASNTPCFQAELLYGVKGVVPGFGFLDPELEGAAVMSQPASAALIERRMQAAGHQGLLRGGSAWSDIFAGEAAESHFCSSTAGLNRLLRALSPFRMVGLVLWHGWSVVRVAAQVVAETLLALTDVVRGQLAGRDFVRELRFVPERVLISAVLREVVTAGACVDADRGLPVVHLNLLGYDEHAHRRGPDSKFATWTLRGIDKTIRRIALAAHRSKNRDYQVWVYSDHGQEAVRSYESVHGEDVADAIRRAWERHAEVHGAAPGERPRVAWSTGERNPRPRHIARELPPWFLTRGLRRAGEDENGDGVAAHEEGDVAIVHRGPIGFVYLPPDTPPERRFAFAEQVAREAMVPHVLVKDADGGARVWAAGGKELRLPGDETGIFGAGHPHRDLLTADVLRLVHHERAGDLVLWSWQPGDPLSFKPENGAHGGPGPRETSPFFVVPPEMASRLPEGRTLRPLDLRALARCVLDPDCAHLPFPAAAQGEPPGESVRLRLMTYNVHGCRGMDGRYSVERIARVIARERPDVVCLQELDHRRTRSGGVDQAREIAQRLENEYHFHSVREAADGLFGDAILSALPLHLVRAAPLPAIESRLDLEPRGVLWVEVDAGGRRVQILNTHLSISERERRLQADAIAGPEWLGDPRCDGPLVLAGDFNATSTSYTGRRLSTLLRDTAHGRIRAPGETRPLTWSGRMPVLRIDHVFASPHFEVERLEVPRTRLTRTASDHLPLVVDLTWHPSAVPAGGTPATPGTAARTS